MSHAPHTQQKSADRPPIISLSHVSKTYYGDGFETKALADATLTVQVGEFVAIMGPSGSGKSTLLHVLGLLDRATGGTYLLNGVNVEPLSDDELADMRNQNLGFVFQSFNLLSKESVYENVKLPLLYSKVPKKDWHARVTQAIAAVRLDHRTNYLVQKLSGGEKQRVAIARSLVCNPNIIFADEPTGNLDSVSGQAVMDTLRDLHEGGATVLLITHEPNTARNAERIIRIKDGVVVSDERVLDRAKKGEAVK